MSHQKLNNEFHGEIKPVDDLIRIDNIDKKIIYLLGVNARLSNSSIAKTLRVSREVVTYRIKRLMEAGFLHGFFTHIDVTRTGKELYMIYIKMFKAPSRNLINKLTLIKEITRVKLCAGNYDLQLIFTCDNAYSFDKVLNNLFKIIEVMIKDYVILRILEEGYLGIELMLRDNERKKLRIKEHKGSAFQKEFSRRTKKNYELDNKSKLILNELQLNARISVSEISKKIGLAPTAVRARIKKMINAGIIKSFHDLFAISALGYQWYKVLFHIRNINDYEFQEYLKNHPNVLWYMKLLGKWNYQFSVFVKSNKQFYDILNMVRKRFNNQIIDYETIIILSQEKYVQRI